MLRKIRVAEILHWPVYILWHMAYPSQTFISSLKLSVHFWPWLDVPSCCRPRRHFPTFRNAENRDWAAKNRDRITTNPDRTATNWMISIYGINNPRKVGFLLFVQYCECSPFYLRTVENGYSRIFANNRAKIQSAPSPSFLSTQSTAKS